MTGTIVLLLFFGALVATAAVVFTFQALPRSTGYCFLGLIVLAGGYWVHVRGREIAAEGAEKQAGIVEKQIWRLEWSLEHADADQKPEIERLLKSARAEHAALIPDGDSSTR